MNKRISTEIKEANNRLSMANLYRWQAQFNSEDPEAYAAVSRYLTFVLKKQRRTTK